jgi:hypothetical protein
MLKINPDTVFTLQEKEEKGEKTGVFSLALGSIKFRYDRITGKEPMIQTASCVAGVRGTELSVFAGADGSALIVVDSGLVEVESDGKAVQLNADEGVEVQPGKPPGDKFVVQRDQIDYKTWNDEKLDSMLGDPVQAVERLQDRMDFYIEKVEEYYTLFQEYSTKLSEERKQNNERLKKEGQDAAQKYDNEVIFPLSLQTLNLGLNVRYFSLVALSMRRYVAGRTYVLLKAKNITDAEDTVFTEYRESFTELLEKFEHSIVPHLVEADI